MSKPIRPEEIAEAKKKLIPPEVFDAVNEILILQSTGGRGAITIKQKDIVNKIIEKLGDYDSNKVYASGYLNFESAYESSGWDVVYDKPGYNESYDAYFKFTPKRNG